MKDKTTVKYILIMLAGCLWGTIGMFVKLLTAAGSSPAFTTFLRLFFGALLLFIIALVKEGIGAFRVSKGTLISCVLLGIVSTSLNNLFYANAVNYLGMSLAVAMLYMAPIFSSIQSKLLFKEHIGCNKIIALALNVVGCVLAATGGDFSEVKVSLIGLLFGVLAAICYSTQNIFGRLATDDASPFVVACYNFTFAAVFTLIATRPISTVENPMDPQILIYGALFGLVPTTIAYLMYFNGIQDLKESSKVAVLCSSEIVVATIIGIVMFKEQPGLVAILGSAMIVVSIAIMSRKTE